jgi:hypothetical protein
VNTQTTSAKASQALEWEHRYFSAKYLGATETQGARFKVSTAEGDALGVASFDHSARFAASAAVANVLGVDEGALSVLFQDAKGVYFFKYYASEDYGVTA